MAADPPAAPPSAGQDSPGEPSPPPPEPLVDDVLDGSEDLDLVELMGLKDITVTARKRVENLQTIPGSVASVDGARASYLRAGGQDLRFLSIRVPSLLVESSFGRTFPRIYVRGLGNPDFDLNASQPVSTVMDNVVLENPTLRGFPIFDIDRIEVLRGPQGTLFGRNTAAGILKIESAKPTHDLEGHGHFTVGQFSFFGFEGVANAPIFRDVLTARISLLYERRDGWIDNLYTNEARAIARRDDALGGFEDVAGRLQLLFTPHEDLRVLVNFHAHSLDGTSRVFRANVIQPGTSDFVDGFRRDQVFHDGDNAQRLSQYGAIAEVEYDAGPIIITSITGYETIDLFSRGDIDGGFGADFAPPVGPGSIPFSSESADAIPELYQVTEELRVASDAWPIFNFQAGFFYFREALTIESSSFDTLGGGVRNGFARQEQQTDAWALFASGTFDIIERLKITGGVRYSSDKKDFVAERLLSPQGPGPLAPVTADPSANVVTWDGSALFAVVPDVNLYARVARGFRAPTIQGRVLFGDTLSVADTEDILSFEGGVKSELFDQRLRVNLTGFYYDINNQQLTAVGGDANTNNLLNADQTLGYGFEVDAEVMPVRDLFIGLGVSYNHTSIQDEDLAVAACGAPCTVLDPQGPTAGTVLIKDNPLPHAPEWIANLSLRYDYQLGTRHALFLFTNWSYRGQVNFFLYESEEYRDDDMLLGDVRIGYVYDESRAELSVYVSNLLDDESRLGGIDFINLTGFTNEPRIWGLDLRVRY